MNGKFNEDRVSVWGDEQVLEMESGYTTLQMYLTPLNYTF